MSIAEVARNAGVSKSTVSRFLRGELNIRPETEARIRASMRELGTDLTPHQAQSLDRVALIVPDLSNPFFAGIAENVVQVGHEHEVETLIAVSGDVYSRELELIESLSKTTRVGGILFIGMNRELSVPASLATKVPLVVVDEPVIFPDAAFPTDSAGETLAVSRVVADNFGGALQATSYLISQGHTRIAHIGGPRGLESARLRREGYLAALEEHGITASPELIVQGPYSEGFGANSLTHLTRLSEPPTAVFAASDIVAIGVISAADTHSLTIPDNLSLIGFDGINMGTWLRPTLSTVIQPLHDIVTCAFAELEAGRGGQPVQDHVLPMELRVRGSVSRLA